MHIPDGYLGPQTYGVLYGVMIPIWALASKIVRRTLKQRQVPFLALGAAFSFVIMMFNIPIPGGSSGHAVGAVIVGILLGPWAAVIAISIALVIQALLFGDGGITAIGANCFNMAFVMPMVGYLVYRLISRGATATSRTEVDRRRSGGIYRAERGGFDRGSHVWPAAASGKRGGWAAAIFSLSPEGGGAGYGCPASSFLRPH